MCNLYSIIIIIGLFNSLKADICIYSHSNGCNNCDISYSLQNLSLITASRFNDDATFKVCSNPLTLLDQVIILQNVKNIIFSSQENSLLTIIDCQHTNGGLEFGNISNLLLYNLIVQDCGALHATTSQTKSHNDVKFQFSSSIYILDCLNVLIKDTSVIGSNGTGLSVIDTNGYVNITNCTFQGNKVTENISFTIPGGGGLYVELTMSCYDNDLGITCNESLEANRTSYIKISNSEFTDNIATTADIFSNTILGAPERNFHGFGRGGGLSIHLRGSFNNVIVISNCNFSNNSAVWGGGLYTTFHDFSYNNSVVIKDTTFKENYSEKGGGGASTGYLHSESSKPEYNSLILIKCQFLGNVAEFGGGISLYSSRSYDYTDLHNDIKLYTCTWTGNTGSYGAAVDVSTDLWDTFTNGFLPAPIFSNCSFTSNYISTPAKHSTIFTSFAKGKGIFLSIGFMIIFKGTTEFEENIGSAMYLISSIAQFSSFSYVHFTKNQGIKGGGIALVGQSALMVTDDSTFTFSHNIAEDRGGAVFQVTLNYKDFITTRSCFIQYFGKRKFIEERNIVFLFNNNTAGDLGRNNEYYGHSMFVSTLYPCFYGCSDKKINNYNETFECIGDFKFVNRSAYEISTYCREIRPSIELFKPFPIIPGKLTKLPVILKDELSNEIQTASRVYIQQNNSDPQYTIKIDASFIYTSDNIVRLFGTPGKHAKILLETVDIKEVSFSMMIQIQHCPPGYVLETSWDFQKQCLCSSIRNKKNIEYYAGISRCNDAEYQAVLRHGYWVGYIDDNDLGKEENLVTGYCPRGYCSKAGDLEYILPNDTDRAKLDSLICGKYRTKMLCAECRGNFSVYYHSITYKCSSSQLCSVGWIFYIISEILPVTLLFIIILILDLNIASGSFNGFIFFIQVTDIMLITGNGAIYFPRFSENLIIAHNLIIGSFNLKFFNVESWSFCLWYRAQTLDLAAFKYVTILYSFMLVMAVIMVLKFCNVRRYSHRCIHFTLKDTVIHGLSAFLTVCYSEGFINSLNSNNPKDQY